MSIPLKALVTLTVDGRTYAPGEWVSLPDAQHARARGMVRYGLAVEAPARPVRKKKAAS